MNELPKVFCRCGPFKNRAAMMEKKKEKKRQRGSVLHRSPMPQPVSQKQEALRETGLATFAQQ